MQLNSNKHFEIALACLIFLPAIVYFQTIGFDYVLDDSIVITENRHTLKGIEGISELYGKPAFDGFFNDSKARVTGGRYRPLSFITFALEIELFGQNPSLSHGINVLLYILTGLLIFILFIKLIPPKPEKSILGHIAFWTALLFLLHPIHTEVVCNIKGRDELLALLFACLTLYISISNWENFTLPKYITLGFTMYLALISKEIAIAFVALIPIILWLQTKSINGKFLLHITPIIGAGIAFLIQRQIVVGQLDTSTLQQCIILNDPFCGTSFWEALPTILSTWTKYIGLLAFPIQQSHDYYPNALPYTNWSDWKVWIAVLSSILAITVIFLNYKKERKVIIIGILLSIIPFLIISNLFFNVGTLMSERLVYFSSLGTCLLLAIAVNSLYKKSSYLSMVFLTLLLGGYGLFTFQRIPVWKTNFELAKADIKTVPNSIKCNTFYGGELVKLMDSTKDPIKKQGLFELANKHLAKAVDLSPGKNHILGWNLMGNAAAKMGNYSKALDIYKTSEKFTGRSKLVLDNTEKVKALYVVALNDSAKEVATQHRINLNSAKQYLHKALNINPSDIMTLENLGIVYGLEGSHSVSLKYFKKAIQLNPDKATNYKNIGLTYQRSGVVDSAQFYFRQYEKMISAKK